MDALKQTLVGLREAFLQMPMPTRVISGALLVVIALGFWMLATSSMSDPQMERIFPGATLSDDEISKLLTAFSTARLNGWDLRNNYIYVPTASRDEYYAAAEGVAPIKGDTKLQQVHSSSNPFESFDLRKEKSSHAKEIDTGNKIAMFPEVLHAFVEHDEMKGGFGRGTTQTASVVVTPVGPDPLPATIIMSIKKAVKGSYAGLSLDAIEVIDVNGRGVDAMEEDNPLFRERIKWEQWYGTQARKLLAPLGRFSIAASVELDPTMDVEKFNLKYDPQGVPLQESNAQLTHESNRPIPGGTPGVATNQFQGVGNRPQAVDPSLAQTVKSTQKSETLSKVTGEEYESSRQASLQPTRVKFSIGVPESYYEMLWRKEYLATNEVAADATIPPLPADKRTQLSAQTEQQIQDALDPFLKPVPAGEDKFPMIVVWDYQDMPTPTVEPTSTVDTAITWLAESWQTLAMLGLALIALLVARGVGKSAGAPRPDFQEGFGLEIPKPVEPEEEAEEDSGLKLQITGGHLKDDLCELVGTNPEAAANVLRNWLDRDAA
ncbi:beta-cystathionase [Planctomycetaceae bacterium SH139]